MQKYKEKFESTIILFFFVPPCRFDASNDGRIDVKEMEKFVRDIQGLLADSDLETCGLTRKASAKKKNITNQVFREMDTDNDGYINEDEFVKACLENGKVSKMLAMKIVDVLVDVQ